MRHRALYHLRLLHHVAMFFLVSVGNADQDALEARSPVTVVRRKISAAVKRLAIGSEKCGERPSALPADHADRSLVAAVDVWTLVAIHLHRNEVLIHNRRNFRIVVRLPIHHMAPVAPHRTNIEQHRLVLPPSGGERFLAPLMPSNRLVHGRAQVGGRSLGQGIEGGCGHDYFSLYEANPGGFELSDS